MDYFEKLTSKDIGPGGYRCSCCNPFRGHRNSNYGLKNYRRLARRRLKQSLPKEIQDSLR